MLFQFLSDIPHTIVDWRQRLKIMLDNWQDYFEPFLVWRIYFGHLFITKCLFVLLKISRSYFIVKSNRVNLLFISPSPFFIFCHNNLSMPLSTFCYYDESQIYVWESGKSQIYVCKVQTLYLFDDGTSTPTPQINFWIKTKVIFLI